MSGFCFYYAFFQVLWYTIERYVCSMTGQSFLTEEYQRRSMLTNKQEEGDIDEVKEEDVALPEVRQFLCLHSTILK